VLIATATLHQECALRAAIFRHLTCETLIGIECSTEGLLTFRLSLHLPFYALRTFKKPCERPKDHRQYSDGTSLRLCRDLSFLNRSTTESSEYLCEAQISFVITGPDKWRWVAYCFVDVYYEMEGKETVSEYCQDSTGEEGMRVDPLTLGCVNAETPTHDAREYFLKVSLIRLNQVKREWQQIVGRFKHEVRAYEENPSPDLEDFVPHTETEKHRAVRRTFIQLRQVSKLTKNLARDLSKTYNAIEDFLQNQTLAMAEFCDPTSTSHQSLTAIRLICNELGSLKQTLESLAARCAELIHDLELYHTQEASQLSNLQNYWSLQSLEISKLQRHLTQKSNDLAKIVLLFFSPISLASSVLSMQGPVVPFLSRSFGSFIGLMSFFVMLGLLVILIQQYGGDLFNTAQPFLLLKKRIRRVKTFSQDQENTAGDPLPTREPGSGNPDNPHAYTPN